VKALITPMLFLEQARGRPAWSLRATWWQRAPQVGDAWIRVWTDADWV